MKTPLILLAATAACLPVSASAASSVTTETAVLAGGCFWGMEAVFEHVKGVRDVVSGYAGGKAGDAKYDRVSSEGTGHAEAVRITFDPRQTSYAQLLKIYFSVAHDPTQVKSAGAGHRAELSLSHFPAERGPEAAGGGVHSAAPGPWDPHRDEDRKWGGSTRPKPITRISPGDTQIIRTSWSTMRPS